MYTASVIYVLAIIFAAHSIGATLLFQDQFPISKPFDPTNPSSSYGYFFFDYTTTTIVNTLQSGELNQTVDPYTNTVPYGPLGALDHVKVLQYNKQQFIPGFRKNILSYKIRIGCSHYGLESHPFPPGLVTNPEDDLRLASCALNTIDFDTMIVADFFITNQGLYAYYERLPYARTQTNYYRAFSQAKRIEDRTPDDIHDLTIVYDSKQRTLSWFVGTVRVLFVTLIGYPSNDPDIVTLIDQGGQDTIAQPTGFRIGWGAFTLLDGRDFWNTSNNTGLVRLNDLNTDYAIPQTFYDTQSLQSNRLWGQGTQITVDSVLVESF